MQHCGSNNVKVMSCYQRCSSLLLDESMRLFPWHPFKPFVVMLVSLTRIVVLEAFWPQDPTNFCNSPAVFFFFWPLKLSPWQRDSYPLPGLFIAFPAHWNFFLFALKVEMEIFLFCVAQHLFFSFSHCDAWWSNFGLSVPYKQEVMVEQLPQAD